MLKPLLKTAALVAILGFFFVSGIQAETDNISQSKTPNIQNDSALSAEEVRSMVEKTIAIDRPGIKISNPQPSAVEGFYQMNIENGPILYANDRGTHFFVGDLFALMEDGIVNVSETLRNEERKNFVNSTPSSEYISFAPAGETKAVLNVFTDVSCGYCRKLHSEMNELNALGIEVRYFAFPRAGVGSADYKKLVSAWCSDNPHSAMTTLKTGQNIPEQLCDNNPVAKHYNSGQRLGIQGTPAVFLDDGQLIPGYRPAAEFARLLNIL